VTPPPPASAATTATIARTATSTEAVVPPTAAASAPLVMAITVDAAGARATVIFDQPVRPGSGSLAPLYLVTFGNNVGCPTPEGNGQAPVEGSGTRALSLPATSLVQGINYVEVAAGFATSLSGVPSRSVPCTAVTSTTAPIPATTTTLPADAPAVVGAVMSPTAGTVTVTFDQPVTGGSPLDLVVFGADRSCATPAGNAQAFVGGEGTRTITATATSLAPGTSYIAIASGWVESASVPASPNKPLRCTAIHAG
jgi:hypothetical protein